MTMTKQISKPTLKLAEWSNLAKVAWTKLAGLQWDELLLYGLMLSVLVWSLSGCASPSVSPTEPAKNPQPPQLSEPLPSESYLQQAQKLIESWRNAVTGM